MERRYVARVVGVRPEIVETRTDYLVAVPRSRKAFLITMSPMAQTAVGRSTALALIRKAKETDVPVFGNGRCIIHVFNEAWEYEALVERVAGVVAESRDRSGRYEFWGKHGKLRDCDGRSCRFLIDAQSGERQEHVPCFCAAHGLATEDPDACRITTRLSVIVPAFAESPGMGVWQLESRGRTTFSDLKGLFRLCRALGLPGVFGLPVMLRVGIVSSRSPETGQPREFPVFRFVPRVSYSEAESRIRAFQAAVKPAQLPPPNDSTPPLGAALDADQEVLSSAAPIAGPSSSDSVDLHGQDSKNGDRPAASPPAAARPHRMPLPEFRELAHQAAAVLGTKGSTPGRTWLLEHYGIPNPARLSDEQYEDAIRRLREIVNGWKAPGG